MAGSPPKPPPPTIAVGSSAPKPPPPAFYAHPTHEALIDSYLRPRVVSGSGIQANFIHEADLYSANPDQLIERYAAATARNGERAWYFFMPLRLKGTSKKQRKRNVDTERKGTWINSGGATIYTISKGQRQIGLCRHFHFEKKVGSRGVKMAWRMMEFRLDPNEGGQEEGSPDLLVLSKVFRQFRSWDAKADGESSTAVAKGDGKTSAASAVVTPGRKGADEEIGAETAAGPGRKRKAGDNDSGAAETVASSTGCQKKADDESAGAATTGEIFADSKDPVDAAGKAEQEEPRDPRVPPLYDFFGDSSTPVDAPVEAEQEPRDPRVPPLYDFFGDSSTPVDAPVEAEQEPRDPSGSDLPFYDFFVDSSAPSNAPEEAEQKPSPRDPRDPPSISSQIHRTQRNNESVTSEP